MVYTTKLVGAKAIASILFLIILILLEGPSSAVKKILVLSQEYNFFPIMYSVCSEI